MGRAWTLKSLYTVVLLIAIFLVNESTNLATKGKSYRHIHCSYIYITYARKTVSSLVDRFVFMSDKLYSVARLISDPQGRDLIANPINIK